MSFQKRRRNKMKFKSLDKVSIDPKTFRRILFENGIVINYAFMEDDYLVFSWELPDNNPALRELYKMVFNYSIAPISHIRFLHVV